MSSVLMFLLALLGIAGLGVVCFIVGFFFMLYLLIRKYGADKTEDAINRLKMYLNENEGEDVDESEEISAE